MPHTQLSIAIHTIHHLVHGACVIFIWLEAPLLQLSRGEQLLEKQCGSHGSVNRLHRLRVLYRNFRHGPYLSGSNFNKTSTINFSFEFDPHLFVHSCLREGSWDISSCNVATLDSINQTCCHQCVGRYCGRGCFLLRYEFALFPSVGTSPSFIFPTFFFSLKPSGMVGISCAFHKLLVPSSRVR